MRVGYIVSRFPSTTETFIAREMRALEQSGCSIALFTIVRQRRVVVHPEAKPFLARLRTAPLWSIATWRAQWYWLRSSPRAYAAVWWRVTRASWRSPSFLVRSWAVVPMAARFALEAREERLEHIHAHWATHPALAAYVVRQLAGLPYSFTAHAHDIFVNRTMLGEKLADADFVAVVSAFNRDLLGGEYGVAARAKMHIVRCGVDTNRYRPLPAAPVDRSRPRIVCVASLQPYKGHRVLLDALAMLRDRDVSFECLLVGDGAERHAIHDQIARLQLGDDVALLGSLGSDDVLRIVRDADVVVLPSVVMPDGKMEGVPVALMEALACEVPVVASRISGIPELVIDGETGLLANAGDAGSLAAAIEQLLGDAARRRRLGAAGRAHVVAEFSEALNVERLRALLQRARARSVRAASSGLEEQFDGLHDQLHV